MAVLVFADWNLSGTLITLSNSKIAKIIKLDEANDSKANCHFLSHLSSAMKLRCLGK